MRKLAFLPLLTLPLACSDNTLVEPELAISPELSAVRIGLIDGQLVNLPPAGTLWPGPSVSVFDTYIRAAAEAGLVVASEAAAGTCGICANDFASLGSFTSTGTVIFDTDALTFGGAPGGVDGGGTAVYAFDNISVPAGTAVVGVGSRPLALVAYGTVTIDGTVTVDGQNALAFQAGPFLGGAGGSAGGVGGDPPGSPGDGTGGGEAGTGGSGAGGGGFGGAGGAGGFAFTGSPGAGGPAYGDLTIAPDGGSGGGSGGTSSANAGGGGGGGFVEVSAFVSISISGTGLVSANGGDGAMGRQGASGGGSGGGIILFAPTVTNDGVVRIDGGDGGPGGCCGNGGGGGGGRILVAGASAGGGAYSAAGGPTTSGTGGESGANGVVTFDPEAFPPCKIEVDIDIKPGSDPNSINCRVKNNHNAAIAVAILTTDDFDAMMVDHTTVSFEGASETHLDEQTGEPRRHEEDVDGDGDMDLVFHFRYGDTSLSCTSAEGMLIGETYDGTPIEGMDSVRMVGGG